MSLVDLSGVQPSQPDYELLPSGEYLFRITDAEVKETKAGTGKYIKVEMTVESGEQESRKVWHNFNIQNPNDEAERIGKEQLVTLMTYAGVKDPSKLDSVSDLMGLTVGAKTKIKKSDQYGDSAVVHYFMAKDEVQPPQKKKSSGIPF